MCSDLFYFTLCGVLAYTSGGLGIKALPKLTTLPAATTSTALPTLGGLGATATTGGGLKLGGVATTSVAPPTSIGKGLGGVDLSTTAGAGKTTG